MVIAKIQIAQPCIGSHRPAWRVKPGASWQRLWPVGSSTRPGQQIPSRDLLSPIAKLEFSVHLLFVHLLGHKQVRWCWIDCAHGIFTLCWSSPALVILVTELNHEHGLLMVAESSRHRNLLLLCRRTTCAAMQLRWRFMIPQNPQAH